MNIKVTYYGRLIELTGTASEEIAIGEFSITGIKNSLENKYPALANTTYQLAENNTILKEDDTIQTKELDIFPPFSGG